MNQILSQPTAVGPYTLIPIYSSSSKKDLAIDPQKGTEKRPLIHLLFPEGLKSFPIIGDPYNGCPHCGAFTLKLLDDQVFVYPHMECCELRIIQHLQWLNEELEPLQLIPMWDKRQQSRAESLFDTLARLENRLGEFAET